MYKIITALENRNILEKIEKQKNVKIISKNIQYREGILEFLNISQEVDFIITNENIVGEVSWIEILKEIRRIKKEIKFIILMEKENKLKEKEYLQYGTNRIVFINENLEQELESIFSQDRSNQERLEEEISQLKQTVLIQKQENKRAEESKQKKEKTLKFILYFKEIKTKTNKYLQRIIKQNKKEITKAESKTILITGIPGVGKSITAINLLNHTPSKSILIEFYSYQNCIHTILGLKIKFSQKQKTNKIIEEIKRHTYSCHKKNDFLFEIEELLIEFAWSEIMEELKKNYLFIFIDFNMSTKTNEKENKEIINNTNLILFIIEPNLIGIDKSHYLIDHYKQEFTIDHDKIKILINKTNQYSICFSILKKIYSDYEIIGQVKNNPIFNLIINSNNKKGKNKKIKKEYETILKKLK